MGSPAVFPVTVAQVPEHAILDKFGKQAYLGNQYIASTNLVNLADATEVPLFYVKNPVLVNSLPNVKALFIDLRSLNCPDPAGSVIFRLYTAPTTVAGGTALTPKNCRFASPNTSIATPVKASPTVATKGTYISAIAVGFAAQAIDPPLFILDAGKDLLITAQGAAATTAIGEAVWWEL